MFRAWLLVDQSIQIWMERPLCEASFNISPAEYYPCLRELPGVCLLPPRNLFPGHSASIIHPLMHVVHEFDQVVT